MCAACPFSCLYTDAACLCICLTRQIWGRPWSSTPGEEAVLPVGMTQEAAESTPGVAVLKGPEKTKAKPKGPLLGQGHRGKPGPPETLLGPLQAFEYPKYFKYMH